MVLQLPAEVPDQARPFLARALSAWQEEIALIGVLGTGSLALGTTDRFSDLDLQLVCRQTHLDHLRSRLQIVAENAGGLLTCFSGEAIGVPDLLICLYGDPLLHVDLKPVAIEAMDHGVQRPIVLMDRSGEVAERVRTMAVTWPVPSSDWYEDHIWIWAHYVVSKLGRGELFDAIDVLGLMRRRVLGPLIARRSGHLPYELRHLESRAPDLSQRLSETLALHSRSDCFRALRASIDLYLELRADKPPAQCRTAAQSNVSMFLDDIEKEVLPS